MLFFVCGKWGGKVAKCVGYFRKTRFCCRFLARREIGKGEKHLHSSFRNKKKVWFSRVFGGAGERALFCFCALSLLFLLYVWKESFRGFYFAAFIIFPIKQRPNTLFQIAVHFPPQATRETVERKTVFPTKIPPNSPEPLLFFSTALHVLLSLWTPGFRGNNIGRRYPHTGFPNKVSPLRKRGKYHEVYVSCRVFLCV